MSDPGMPVIIALPPEIDITNASGVLELITAACAPGVPAVIADLTGTSFCDSAGLNHLIQASHHAAASGTELRLAISPDGAVSRIIDLTGLSQYIPVYPSARLAADGGQPPGQPGTARHAGLTPGPP